MTTKKKSQKTTRPKSRQRRVDDMTVIIKNYDIPTKSDSGIEVFSCSPTVEMNLDTKIITLSMSNQMPNERQRYERWFAADNPFGTVKVMSRIGGAQIRVSLSTVSKQNFREAIDTIGRQFATALSVALVKMDSSLNLNINEEK